MKTYLNTNLENNFSKLLETLKDCLQPKDQKPDNRPDCQQLLQKISEFSVDKNLLTESKSNYEEFQKVLEKQKNGFLKKNFNNKINEQDQIQLKQESNVHQDRDMLHIESLKSIIDDNLRIKTSDNNLINDEFKIEKLKSKIYAILNINYPDDKDIYFSIPETLYSLFKFIDDSPKNCEMFASNNGTDLCLNVFKVFKQ